ncbi:hypothetical protein PR048_021791 [Dryococelus australis]|uniref:Uncharacterized protein n=1 Tax=Dryococelus australis TaxID=614101 RepID=A0ABQ9GZ65_9NEOP|nr:hypothetical protein PR048_021791 [Dryococelus australis]
MCRFQFPLSDLICVFDICQFGFTLDRTLSDAMNPYLDSHPDNCLLNDLNKKIKKDVIFFILDFKCNE